MTIIIISAAFTIALALISIIFSRQYNAARKNYEDRIAELNDNIKTQKEEFRHQISLEFKVMADEIMKSNSSQLNHANSMQIEALLNPLKERLEQFNKACTDSYVKENASRQSLTDRIDKLVTLNMEIGREARNLTNALKHDSRQQGAWGEMVLETILEKGGLTRNVNFFTQQTRDEEGKVLRSDEGRSLRPDVIIALPDNHKMIVDSKVSLTAYMDYCNSADKQTAGEAGRRHIASLKKHVRELSEKAYQHNITGCAEHVLMFIPNESAYIDAIRIDPEICNFALERKIVIVTPAHLLSVVQLVAQLWRQDSRDKNTEKIAALGGLLYDKFVKFTDNMKRMEKAIDEASKAYENCYKDLTSGGTSLVARAERLRQLGAKNKSALSRQILDDTVAE